MVVVLLVLWVVLVSLILRDWGEEGGFGCGHFWMHTDPTTTCGDMVWLVMGIEYCMFWCSTLGQAIPRVHVANVLGVQRLLHLTKRRSFCEQSWAPAVSVLIDIHHMGMVFDWGVLIIT